jgi:hypothetical protein
MRRQGRPLPPMLCPPRPVTEQMGDYTSGGRGRGRGAGGYSSRHQAVEGWEQQLQQRHNYVAQLAGDHREHDFSK